MPSAYRLLISLAGLVPVLALGTGQKFKIVDGGRSFDRFITIWLENQVRLALPCIAPHHFCLRLRKVGNTADSPCNDRTSTRSSRTPTSPT